MVGVVCYNEVLYWWR